MSHDALAPSQHVPDDADAVVDGRLRSPPGRRQHAVYAAFATYLDRDLDLKVRTVAATELGSSTDGPTVHLHELPMDALATGEYTEKFVQIFDANGRLHLSSASLIGAPALIPPEVVQAALAGQAPAGHGRRRRPSGASRRAPDPQGLRNLRGARRRLSGSDRCPPGATGLGAPERLGRPVWRRPRRSATGWPRARLHRSWTSPIAPRESRRASSPSDSSRRQARTKSAR